MQSSATARTEPFGNRLLESILRDCRGLAPHIESISFDLGHELYATGDRLTHVYFPTKGVLSTLIQLRDGGSAETLTVGSEGFVGLPVFLGVTRSLEQVLQQGPGELLRITSRTFCREIAGHRRTETLLKRFAAYRLCVATQNVACNARHDIRQRTCRWILSTADRTHSNDVQLSQALLAEMLGVRRQSVGTIAVELKRAGMIDSRRSRIRILDRRRLRDCACECYEEARSLFDELVGVAL